MHEIIVEVAKLVEELAEVKRQLADAKKVAEYAKRDAIDALKADMQKALMESDIKREVAIARLDAYEKTQNKDDFNKDIREMLRLAITGMGAKPQGQQQQKPQQDKQN